jgi:hypothetical protein
VGDGVAAKQNEGTQQKGPLGGGALINVRLALRPLRLGILVKHGDFEGLWRAVRYNTCLWGGYFNPIIPVRDVDLVSRDKRSPFDPPLADYLVRTFEVDLLHAISDDATLKSFGEAREHLRWPRGEDIVSDEGTEHEHLALLDVKPVVNGLLSGPSREAQGAVASLPLDGWHANVCRVRCMWNRSTPASRRTCRANIPGCVNGTNFPTRPRSSTKIGDDSGTVLVLPLFVTATRKIPR